MTPAIVIRAIKAFTRSDVGKLNQPSASDSFFNQETGIIELWNINGCLASYRLTSSGKLSRMKS